jgi:hypothetical protein
MIKYVGMMVLKKLSRSDDQVRRNDGPEEVEQIR